MIAIRLEYQTICFFPYPVDYRKMLVQSKPRVLAIVGPEYAGEEYIEAFKAQFDLDVRAMHAES